MCCIVSLGCAKNFVDTEIAAGSLVCAGFGLTSDEEEARVRFINTCAFLEDARKEAEAEIKAAVRWKKRFSGRRIVVSGCLSAWDKDGRFRARFPDVDLWTGISSAAEIGPLAKAVLESTASDGQMSGAKGPSPAGLVRDTQKRDLPDHTAPRLLLNAPHYAYLRIADGCNNHCAYCLIPSIRGPLRSRSVSSLVTEAKQLLRNGVRELILIAQDTSAFGSDIAPNGKPLLAELLKKLNRLPGEFHLRLMYLHPAGITPELVRAMKECDKLLPCVEMPIQHIADSVLGRMGRKIGGQATRNAVAVLAQHGFRIRTTLLTGFPGETPEDFAELLDYVRSTAFARLGVFAYSKEPDTPAASMTPEVSRKTALARRKKLLDAQAELSLRANKLLMDTVIPVLLDSVNKKSRSGIGRTFSDAPDIDNTVHLSDLPGSAEPGDTIFARVTRADVYDLHATTEKGWKCS